MTEPYETLEGVKMTEGGKPVDKLLFDGKLDHTLQNYKFVDYYFTTNNIEVKREGVYQNNVLLGNVRVLAHEIKKKWDIFKMLNSIKGFNLSIQDILMEVESRGYTEWRERTDVLRASLTPEVDREWFDQHIKILAKALCGRSHKEDSLEFRRSMAFLAHFFWQVQTKLQYGAQAVINQGNEAMLLLVSAKQKSGKSTAVRMMVRPFSEERLVWKTSLDRLEDGFSLCNLADNYIAWFDDMGRSNLKSMSRFKQIVTDDEINFRRMFTQQEVCMPKTATLIGTSNQPARVLVKDSTGLRRFHEIYVNSGSACLGEGIDLDVIKAIDFERMFRSVPLGDTPLFDYITPIELDDYEETNRLRHVVEEWILALEHNSEEEVFKIGKELYRHMRTWALDAGYTTTYIPTYPLFRAKMHELGHKEVREGSKRGFYIRGYE